MDSQLRYWGWAGDYSAIAPTACWDLQLLSPFISYPASYIYLLVDSPSKTFSESLHRVHLVHCSVISG